jgi:hypothetical protein
MNPWLDPDNLPDPDDEEWLSELRDSGLDEEQIEQAQAQVRFFQDLTPEQRAGQIQQGEDISMAMSLEGRVVNGPDLLALAALAAKRDYNRQLHPNTLEDLDPEGTNLLRPILIHRHIQGEDAPAHMRCLAMLKLVTREADDPFEATMDVPMEQFLRLHTVSAARRMLGLEPTQGDVERIVSEFWRMIEEGEIEPGEPRLRVLIGGIA